MQWLKGLNCTQKLILKEGHYAIKFILRDFIINNKNLLTPCGISETSLKSRSP